MSPNDAFGAGGGIPQPTLPQVDLDDDVWRARRKAERAGMEVPTKRAGGGERERGRGGASSPLDFDDGIYPGRECFPPSLYFHHSFFQPSACSILIQDRLGPGESWSTWKIKTEHD